MFDNIEIQTDELPAAADVDWQPMDPGLRRQQILVGAILFAGLLVAFTIAWMLTADTLRENNARYPLVAVGGLIPLIGLWLIIWPFVSVPRMGYAVRDKDVLYRSGVLWRQVTAIPYNRIQHVEKDTGPLDRRFGLANLKVFTAGGAGGDLRIGGLSESAAERLRGHILQRIGAAVEHS